MTSVVNEQIVFSGTADWPSNDELGPPVGGDAIRILGELTRPAGKALENRFGRKLTRATAAEDNVCVVELPHLLDIIETAQP